MGTSVSRTRATLAENIRELAVRRKVGVNALADFAVVSRSQMYDVLSCRKGASVDWIDRVAGALEVEACELLRKQAKRKRN